ncbi:P-loop containing nucleoside triphosphate hydrolase protein [Peniophora sp. CONT]|nr:P-loop containing nucleoside triphosphate hydrolase protein [Peniophora sp. CONT]
MEAFQLLSRGGAQFDKRRFQADVNLFNKTVASKERQNRAQAAPDSLPSELDFFKYSQPAQPKRKADEASKLASRKRRKVLDEEDEQMELPEHEVSDSEGEEGEKDGRVPRQRVTVKGHDAPESASSFVAMKQRYNIAGHIMANLEKFGFERPTGIQSYGCPILLEKRDMAAISPTGTGKTLSYLLPIMSALHAPSSSAETELGSGVRAVILAPTKELAHQIHNECLKLALGRKWRVILFSKATAATLADKAVRDKVDIIISTPLRLVSALQTGNLDLTSVRHLVLDEADRMLDTEFLSQVQEIVAACTHPEVQKAVFSATLPANAEKIAMDMLRDPIRIVVGLKDTPLPLIAQSLTYVADDSSKLPTLLTHLAQPYNPPVVIFTSTQPRAASLAEELVLHDIPNVGCLHAGMTDKERADTVSRMRRGETWVLVSTEVMARGMDFKGVREVINYDFPQSVQSYVHRIGRTGRAGREGKAVTYFTNEDAPYIKSVANVIMQSGFSVPDWIVKLPKPSKMKRKQMGKVKRADTVNPARRIGRDEAIKRRDMIAGSKRRKEKDGGALISDRIGGGASAVAEV